MKIKNIHFYLLLFLAFTIPSIVYAQTVYEDCFDGEVYVKFNDEYPVDFSKEFIEPQSLEGLNEELVRLYGVTQARFSFNKIPNIKLQRTVRLKFSAIDKVDSLLKHFEQLPFIEYAEKIPYAKVPFTPVDGEPLSWHLKKIKAEAAWDYSKGSSDVLIAVVDDEIDIYHEDLQNNIWVNPLEIPANGIDDDGNGYVDDVSGWDVSDNDNNVTNVNNTNLDHGTRSAGVIAAVTNNNKGVASIGFKASILPVKITKDNATARVHNNIFEGLAYAAIMNPDIINCSCGGSAYTQTGKNTVDFIVSKGIPLSASAHNYNNTSPIYPAAFHGVISVAATDANDEKASFSNYGSWVKISAPGIGLRSLQKNNRYVNYGGTSASAPVVSGLLGLMKSYHPNITKVDLEFCLFNSADNIDNLNPSYIGQLGSGRITAEKAMQCVDSIKKAPPIINISTSNNYICPYQKIELMANSYRRPLDSATWYIYKGGNAEIVKGVMVEVSFEQDSAFDVAVVAYDSFGKDSVYLSQYIQVNSLFNTTFYFEDFESLQPNIRVLNPNADNTTWKRINAPKTNNAQNSAFKINYYESANSGDRDAFITPVFDLSRATKAWLYFKHAYYNNKLLFSNDSLIVYASIDSGQTFPYTITTKVGADLNTSTTRFITSSFEVIDDNDWCSVQQNKCLRVTLDSLVGKKNVALKFEAYHDKGNNLFIDDIKVYALCGDVINFKPKSDFTVTDTAICQNSDVQFEATSTSFPKDYMWIFEGGIPDTSYSKKPQVNYKQAGTYDVTLISSNVLGSDTLYLKDYVTCSAPPQAIVSDTVKYVCNGDSVYFTASGASYIQWYKHNTKQTVYDSIMGDRPVQNTLYSVKVITQEGCYDSTTARAILLPLPPTVFINKSNDKLEATHNAGNFSYRWYINDTLAAQYSTSTIQPKKTGNYKVEIVDSAGCTSVSNSTYFVYKTDGIADWIKGNFKIYPNPAHTMFIVDGLMEGDNAKLILTDLLGRKVYETITQKSNQEINVTNLPKGVYILSIWQNAQTVVFKIRVE